MRIYFSRHGESQANLLHEVSNRGLRHGLTLKGRAQALDLAQHLQGAAIAHIYTSPTLRAIETTVLVANQLGVDYEVVDALREFDCGEAEGRSDEGAWEQWHWVVDSWLDHRRFDQRIPGGECFYDIHDRFIPFVQGLVERYRDSDTHLLCIGHGGLYFTMLPEILVNVDLDLIKRLEVNYTTRIVCEPRPQGLVCVEWNGVILNYK